MTEHLHLDGAVNLRDLGGLPLAGGGSTRYGVVYRADALSRLSPEGVAALEASPIGVVVDLRTPAEQQRMGADVLPSGREVQLLSLPVLEGAFADAGAQAALAGGGEDVAAQIAAVLAHLPTLGDLYVGMLSHAAESFAVIARKVSESRDDEPTAVVVHCTAGKDRTGVAAALLLDAAGVTRDAIVADYTATEANLAGPWSDAMLGQVAAMGVPITDGIRDLVTSSPASAIEQALEWLDAEHGGSAGYLRSGGLTDDELARLRARLRG